MTHVKTAASNLFAVAVLILAIAAVAAFENDGRTSFGASHSGSIEKFASFKTSPPPDPNQLQITKWLPGYGVPVFVKPAVTLQRVTHCVAKYRFCATWPAASSERREFHRGHHDAATSATGNARGFTTYVGFRRDGSVCRQWTSRGCESFIYDVEVFGTRYANPRVAMRSLDAFSARGIHYTTVDGFPAMTFQRNIYQAPGVVIDRDGTIYRIQADVLSLTKLNADPSGDFIHSITLTK